MLRSKGPSTRAERDGRPGFRTSSKSAASLPSGGCARGLRSSCHLFTSLWLSTAHMWCSAVLAAPESAQPHRPCWPRVDAMSAVLLESHPHGSLRTAENAAQDKAREVGLGLLWPLTSIPPRSCAHLAPASLQPCVQSCLFTRQFTLLSSGNIRTSPVNLQRK